MFQSLNLLNYLTAVQNITSAMEITGVAPATASAGPKNSWTASAAATRKDSGMNRAIRGTRMPRGDRTNTEGEHREHHGQSQEHR